MGLFFYLKLKKETNARIYAQNKMLQQQSKMASMGEMLDAVAHQWKQPLNAITMYLQLLQSDFEDGLVDKAYIDEMEEGTLAQIEHMTTTLSEFRNFFRPNQKKVNFNLLKVINSVLLLTKDEFLKNQITIEVDVDESIVINGNENEFKHLIINLINNSKDAFNENNIKERKILIKATTTQNHTSLTIKDNAGGIPKHAIKHIFEPNFTTKEVGKGTGIGLYMSAQILEKMGAKIKVKNIDNGACFFIDKL
jgi:signal transduction histidine kinase